ncbi:MAG TPA: amidohydrolase family protein [Vicinamibacteria bacterium]|nr:amidohydrolase family protein [Vicinamibacteria bacterium]
MVTATRREVVMGVASALSALTPLGPRASGEAASGGEDLAQGRRTLELPGFVDLQVNGFAGVDFGDPALDAARVLHAVAAMEKTGVTRFLATLITSSRETFSACARTIARVTHPAIAGLHMEGPYVSPEDGYRGAHPRSFVRGAEVDDFRRRQEAAEGRIRLVTLAPEAPGALRLIEHLTEGGVRVAIGHTAATGGEIKDAVSAGATLSTHLGNGCPPLLARHPNVIWEQLAEDRLMASFIVDGHHLPPATVRTMVRAKTPARSILVTDAIAAAGMPPGRYTLGGQEVELSAAGRVGAPGAPHLAGSALRLDAAIANTARFCGLPIEEVAPMASTRAAAYLGIGTAGTVVVEWDPATFALRVARVVA